MRPATIDDTPQVLGQNSITLPRFPVPLTMPSMWDQCSFLYAAARSQICPCDASSSTTNVEVEQRETTSFGWSRTPASYNVPGVIQSALDVLRENESGMLQGVSRPKSSGYFVALFLGRVRCDTTPSHHVPELRASQNLLYRARAPQ